MKEILYIQAGSLANFTGTAFWNTQEAYLNKEEEPQNQAAHDVSFHERQVKGESTLCPRVLIFDRKEQFGTLSQANALTGIAEDGGDSLLWSGEVVKVKQEIIEKSEYQLRMEDEDKPHDNEPTESDELRDSTVRYWSDFNRVYHDPRSIQKLPNLADWETADGNWYLGKETFSKYNEDASLMEEPVRQFLEECDTIQGMKLIHDTASFGAFVDSFLASFRDDFAKLPALAFPLLAPGDAKGSSGKVLREAVNDAMCLRGLNEFVSMTVPLNSPSTWDVPRLGSDVAVDVQSVYQTSAILSSHIESVTLPLRTQGSEDLSSFCSQLNWRGTTRFAHLRGTLPFTCLNVDTELFDFSTRVEVDTKKKSRRKEAQYARRDVTRGLSSSGISQYDAWSIEQKLQHPYLTTSHFGGYPIPTSFPCIFPRKGILSPARTVPAFSTLTNSSASVKMFTSYAQLVQECVRKRTDVGGGLDLDELKDLGNDLWTMVDNYADGNTSGSEEEGFGDDEE